MFIEPLTAMAIAPVAFLLIYIYKKDVIAKEPTNALVKSFLWGFLGVTTFAVIVEFTLSAILDVENWANPFTSAFTEGFIVAAIPEEFFKFIVLFLLVWKSKDFDENFDGIVYAVFVGMGFACAENILYVKQYGPLNALVRAFTAVPLHFFCAIIMGYYFSLAKFQDPAQTKSHLFKGFIYAMLTHGIYDTILFMVMKIDNLDDQTPLSPTVYVLLILPLVIFFFVFNFFVWRYGFKRIKELRDMDLALLPQINQAKQPLRSNSETPNPSMNHSNDYDDMNRFNRHF